MTEEIDRATLASLNAKLADKWRNMSEAEAERVVHLARIFTEDDADALAMKARVPAEAVRLVLGEIGTKIFNMAGLAMESVNRFFPQIHYDHTHEHSRPKAKYDQLFATEKTVIERVRVMMESGDLPGKEIVLVGDDDRLSIALSLTGLVKSIRVLDIDKDLVWELRQYGMTSKCPFQAYEYDVRKPLPEQFISSADVVFTDPPYTPDGQRIFLARAWDLLRNEDGNAVYLCQSPADLSSRDLMLIHGAIHERNYLIDALWKSFNVYQEAKRTRGETVIKNFTSDLLRLIYVRHPRAYTKPRPSKLFEYRYK